MKNIILFVICLGHAHMVKSQDIEIVNIQLKKGNVEVYYNIIDERLDRTYSVSLYTSKDNFLSPVEKVTGDVGVDIPVGENKKVVWDAKQELGADFDDKIAIELKGNYYVPFITLEGIDKGKVFERGVSHDIVWAGGRGDNILQFDLYQDENLVKSFEQKPNNGKTSIRIPGRIAPGNNYRIKISDANNRDEVVFSQLFVIKRRVSLPFQVAAGAVAGVGLYLLIQSLIPEPEFQIESAPPVPSR